jgi:hypothetical protein
MMTFMNTLHRVAPAADGREAQVAALVAGEAEVRLPRRLRALGHAVGVVAASQDRGLVDQLTWRCRRRRLPAVLVKLGAASFAPSL